MDVRFYRYSGYPPAPELKAQIKAEHIAGYDAIVAEIGQVNEDNKDVWPVKMEALDQSLLDKYPRHEDKNLDHISDVESLVKLYGSTLAFCMETREEKEHLTCYIMDLE